jgi:hypothetical protein
MPRKKIKRHAKPRSEQERPTVSFRITRPLLGVVDGVAGRLAIDRSSLISLVLTEYLQERGEEGIAALARKETPDDRQVDLFA